MSNKPDMRFADWMTPIEAQCPNEIRLDWAMNGLYP
jgi:hypothetical protein